MPAKKKKRTERHRFEIWDTYAVFPVESFDTLLLALVWIRGRIEQDEAGGEDPTSGVMQYWSLTETTASGAWGTIALGRELIDLARKLT